jgi:glycerate kinase
VHLVVAPDKFRGTATAAEMADRIRTTATALGWTCTAIPLADGGEGTLDAFGGGNRSSAVTGPLGERVDAAWRLAGGTAVIEMAAASGLPDAIAGADLVITGEGRLDHTSLQRKVVGGVLALASAASVACAVIAGQVRGRGPGPGGLAR